MAIEDTLFKTHTVPTLPESMIEVARKYAPKPPPYTITKRLAASGELADTGGMAEEVTEDNRKILRAKIETLQESIGDTVIQTLCSILLDFLNVETGKELGFRGKE